MIDLFERWAKTSWSEQLASAHVPTEIASVDLSKLALSLRGLRTRNDYSNFERLKVTGAISEGWLDLNKRTPFFQASFEAVVSQFPDTWNPAFYLVHYAARCKADESCAPPYDLGRAIRNLPSFIREDSLKNVCTDIGLNVSQPSLQSNFSDHADLYIEIHGVTFTVWSFINTKKSRKAVLQKLLKRGNDLKGVHVLAPIDMDTDVKDVFNWKILDSSYASELMKSLDLDQVIDFERTLSLMRLGLPSDPGFVLLDSSHVNRVRHQSKP